MKESTTKNSIQLRFFENLKQSISQNLSLANEVADILEISTDGAYRRIRGESILSVDEMAKLCRHYKISPEFLSEVNDTSATFHFQKMISDEKGFEDYIKNIYIDLQKIKASNPKHIVYAAGDLPVFWQFVSPEFSEFKVFFWKKAVLNLASVEGKKFSVSNIKPEMAEFCKKISELYVQIPSTEIWHQDTIASNLNLIDFAWQSGLFETKEDALMICGKLSEIIVLIEKQAAKSSKFLVEEKWAANEGNFTMYQSEFVLMNNHIFVTAGNSKFLYLTHNTFNSIVTNNIVFCNENEEWLKNIIRKSTQISGVGEKQRYQFFRKTQEKIADLITRINS